MPLADELGTTALEVVRKSLPVGVDWEKGKEGPNLRYCLDSQLIGRI
jgi:hypothetical protein